MEFVEPDKQKVFVEPVSASSEEDIFHISLLLFLSSNIFYNLWNSLSLYHHHHHPLCCIRSATKSARAQSPLPSLSSTLSLSFQFSPLTSLDPQIEQSHLLLF
jgi:hypothetical protein